MKHCVNHKDLSKVEQLYTHTGFFHADDLFSLALLRTLGVNAPLHRVTDEELPSDSSKTLMFDIGLGRYDHHQCNKEHRLNGKPYASFGLLWRDFGELLVSKSTFNFIDRYFIEPIDISDNCLRSNVLSLAIISLNGLSNGFSRALHICTELLRLVLNYSDYLTEDIIQSYNPDFEHILANVLRTKFSYSKSKKFNNLSDLFFEVAKGTYDSRTLTYANQKLISELSISLHELSCLRFLLHLLNNSLGLVTVQQFLSALVDILFEQLDREVSTLSTLPYNFYTNGVMVLSAYYPYRPSIADVSLFKDVNYVVMPSMRDSLTNEIYAVSQSSLKIEPKCPFPVQWRGKSKSELSRIFPGLSFCHASGFLCVVSKELTNTFIFRYLCTGS